MVKIITIKPMKEQLLFIIGLAFSLSAFALKVALILPFVEKRKIRLFILGVYALFFLSGYAFVSVLERHIFFFLEKGVYLHFLLAFGLLFWGLNLLLKPSGSKKALFLYILPCPVCLTSLLLATLYYKKLFPSSFLSPLGPILPLLFFLFLTFLFYLLFPLFLKISPTKHQEEALRKVGVFMFFSGLYILGSFYFPEKLEGGTLSLSEPLSHKKPLNLKEEAELFLLLLLLISGFFLGFIKSRTAGGKEDD
jgi:predicted transporter